MTTVLEKLLSKTRVSDCGCWEWTASKSGKGYGQFFVNGKNWPTHRLSYELHHGPIPKGMFVCHRCDNRICVNTDHLFLGTNADNVADMVAKGRQSKHKLTESDVIAIRSTRGATQKELASRFGVSSGLVSLILARKSWGWLPEGAR